MKKKIILSSVVTIMLCLALIAGSTFALFTSADSVSFVVSSGKVEVTAETKAFEIFSVRETAGGSIVDEFGGTYEYEQRVGTFANGGTATLDNNMLTIVNMTPGDKVTITIEMMNYSNVAAQYRVKIIPTEGAAMDLITMGATDPEQGLKVSGGDSNTFNFNFDGNAVVGNFVLMANGTTNGTKLQDVTVTLEMPVTTGNDYQNKEASFQIVIEAVQANAANPNAIDNIG